MEVARIAARQRGVVSRAQLEAAGLGRRAIEWRVAQGRLHSLLRGVYLVGHPHPPALARETAALMATGEDAALSHRTAAHLWGLLQEPGHLIHLLVARRYPTPRSGIAIHYTSDLQSGELRRPHGLPTTAPLRTLLDLANVTTDRELEKAVEEAQVRRLVQRDRLEAAADAANGRRGVARLRALLIDAARAAPTRSEAEARFLSLVDKARLPPPQVNVRLHGYELDILWREQRLAVEIDGFAFHSSRTAFERDRLRDAELQSRGLRVIRVTWRQIVLEPEAVAVRVARALDYPGSG